MSSINVYISFIIFLNLYVSCLFVKSLHSLRRVTSSDNIKDSIYMSAAEEASEEENKKLMAILREQGLSINDLKDLQVAITTGKRYNKPKPSPIPPSPPINKDDKISQTQSTTNESNTSHNVQSNEALSSTTSRPKKKLSFVLKNTKSIPSISSSSSTKSTDSSPIKVSSSSTNTVRKSTSTSSSNNSITARSSPSPPSPSSTTVKSNRISSDGITLKMMLETLIDEYGFEYLYEQTHLRCFQVRPTLTSALKALRQEDMLWGRKKIEFLYFEYLKDNN